MDQVRKQDGMDTDSIRCNMREAFPWRPLELREAEGCAQAEMEPRAYNMQNSLWEAPADLT